MRRTIIFTIIIIVIIICAAAMLFFNGIIKFNNPSLKKYPVRGIDVSSYQGEIDWEKLVYQEKQTIRFAFIKSTEGSNFKDKYFDYNFSESQKAGLYTGAYHFFSYDSPGKLQAENYIESVGKINDMLPPVVDIEFYGDKEKNQPGREETQENLNELLDELENFYGVKPIIYATMKSYNLYIKDSYEDYPLWIRNVLSEPGLEDNRKWDFWQYTDRETLDGYNGRERFIDMNVFYGSEEDLQELLIKSEN